MSMNLIRFDFTDTGVASNTHLKEGVYAIGEITWAEWITNGGDTGGSLEFFADPLGGGDTGQMIPLGGMDAADLASNGFDTGLPGKYIHGDLVVRRNPGDTGTTKDETLLIHVDPKD